MKPRGRLSVMAVGLLTSALLFGQQENATAADVPLSQATPISQQELAPGDIRKIQTALNDAGYDAGSVDGVWGVKTEEALRDFQKAKNLEPTGNLDEGTVLALGFSRAEFAAMIPPHRLSESDVRQVQEALNKAGYPVGAVDGVWGPSTGSALRDFQEAKGLDPSGSIDRETVLALGLSTSDFAAGEFDEESLKR